MQRHLRLWKDAAASKGLVQFDVPNDANIYHPEFCDDWPQPLLSSHEERSCAQDPSHRTASGEIVSSYNSTKAMDVERNHRLATEEKTHRSSVRTAEICRKPILNGNGTAYGKPFNTRSTLKPIRCYTCLRPFIRSTWWSANDLRRS